VGAVDRMAFQCPCGFTKSSPPPNPPPSALALIAGARHIQAGTVRVLGGDMADRAHRAAACPRIAYMPQGLGRLGLDGFRGELRLAAMNTTLAGMTWSG
jgi:hypothetical protein